MKKVVLLSMVALLVMGAVAFATTAPIYTWEGSPTTWTEVATPAIGTASASGVQNNTGLGLTNFFYNGKYWSILPGTPTWTKLHRINWKIHISQWIYLSIEFLDFYAHVDAPGDYALDSLTLHVITNGGINVYFNTGGWLTDVSSPTNKMPTWGGFKEMATTTPVLGLPANGANNSFWYDFDYINTVYSSTSPVTVLNPYGGEMKYILWFGFRVAELQSKGDYTTWADIYIQSDP